MDKRRRAIAKEIAERLGQLRRFAVDPKLADLIAIAEAEAVREATGGDLEGPQRPQ